MRYNNMSPVKIPTAQASDPSRKVIRRWAIKAPAPTQARSSLTNVARANQINLVNGEEEDERGQEAHEVEEQLGNEFIVLNPRRSQQPADIFQQVGVARPREGPAARRRAEAYIAPHMDTDERYLEKLSQLNQRQRTILMEILHRMKAGEIFTIFISGGAGVGKSFFITTLYQALMRYFNRQPGNDGATIKILLCAPTGKAAFNIHGMTLHSSFSIPVQQRRGQMTRLSADVANTISATLRDVKLLIIDEISMVSSEMFVKVNTRMRQIFRNDQRHFGGLPVIVMGDFNQLRPIYEK